MMKPRVLFLGEKPLAEKCLKFLLTRSCEVVGILTRSKDDGLWWGKNGIKDIAKQHQIPLLKRADIPALKPDILFSVLYPFVIEPEVFEAVPNAFNLHLAPLPEYKGCNCGSHALMKGDARFGVTLHEMTKDLDSGRIVEKRYFPLSNTDTSKSLYEKAVDIGYDIWLNQLDRILNGTFRFEDFVDDGSKPYPRNSVENKCIPGYLNRTQVYNFVRGLDFEPFPPAFFLSAGEKIELRQRDFDPQTLHLHDSQREKQLSAYLDRGFAERAS